MMLPESSYRWNFIGRTRLILLLVVIDEKAKDAQTYDVEESESEPEPDKEAPAIVHQPTLQVHSLLRDSQR